MRTSLARLILLTCVAALTSSSASVVVARGCPSNGAMRGAPASAGATLTFRRIFKSSSPEFIEISVREDSDEATYEIRQLDEDPGATIAAQRRAVQRSRAKGRSDVRCARQAS